MSSREASERDLCFAALSVRLASSPATSPQGRGKETSKWKPHPAATQPPSPKGKARSYIAFIILITVGRGLAPAGNDKFPQTNGNENLQICYFLFSFIYGGSKHQYNRKLFSLYPQTRMAFPQGKASFFQKFSKAVGARAASQRRYPDKRHPAARRAAALPATGGNYLG